MKNNLIIRAAFLLALICVVGVLPLSAFAADGLSDAPGSITQKSSKFMTVSGRLVQYESANSVLRNEGSARYSTRRWKSPATGPPAPCAPIFTAA